MEKTAQRAKRLLIVDDEKTVVQSLATILIRHGYYVDTETDGNEALRKVTEGDYDLAIVDILIPERSGFQICERIRSRDRLRARHTPIIIISARDTPDFRFQAKMRRVDEYLPKPFRVGDLRRRIEGLLTAEPSAGPPQRDPLLSPPEEAPAP